MSEAIELFFRFRSVDKQEVEVLRRSLSGVTAEVREGDKVLKGFQRTVRETGESFGGAFLKADLMARGITSISAAIKDYVIDAAKYAARTEQLITVSDSLARVNGLSVTGVRQQAEEVRKLGITTQTAYETTARLIQARLDVSKAPELARVAQDAAKIGGINSSEALEKIVTGIATGQVRQLHSVGLMVSFREADAQFAATHHKNVQALDASEKAEARLQVVLKAGAGIFGTYEASLTSAGGQMQSLSRYTDELKNKFGEGLQPVLFDIVGLMRQLSTYATNNIDKFQHITAGAAAIGIGGSAFAGLSMMGVPLPASAGIAALAAGATYVAADQDPLAATITIGKSALTDYDDRVNFYRNEVAGGNKNPAFLASIEHATEERQQILAETRFRVATIMKQRQRLLDGNRPAPQSLAGRLMNPNAVAGPRPSAYRDIDMGDGVKWSASDLKHAFDFSGGNLKPGPLDDDDASAQFDALVKEQTKSLTTRVHSAALALLSGPARFAQQGRDMNADLNYALLPFPKLAGGPEVAGLRKLIGQVGTSELAKYSRDREVRGIEDSGSLALSILGIDTSGRKRRPGDMTQANAEYQQSLDTAGLVFGKDRDQGAYEDRVRAAHRGLTTASARSAADIANDASDTQVSGVQASSALSLRMLGIGSTLDNSGGLAGQENQIRVQAAAKEYAITGDLKQLRQEMASAWADKVISTAEREFQLSERNKANRIEALTTEEQFRERLATAKADPSDNFTAIRTGYKERLELALQIYDVDRKGDDLKKRSLEAEHDLVLSIAELRKKERQEYEAVSGGVFDALISRGRGSAFRNLILGQVATSGKVAFQHLAGLGFDSFKKLGIGDIIPGQTTTDSAGNPHLTTLGKILADGPLGTDQAKLAARGLKGASMHGVDAASMSTDTNTVATNRNSDAIDRLTARIERIVGSGPGGLSRSIHSIGGPAYAGSVAAYGVSSPSYSPAGSSSSSISFPGAGPDDFSPMGYGGGYLDMSGGDSGFMGSGGAASDVAVNGVQSDNSDLPAYNAPNQELLNNPVGVKSGGSSPLQKTALGVAAAGGALAAFQDFRRGGARNIISGVGASLGSAAAIAAMIPGGQLVALGLGIASAVTSMVPMLFGDPKAKFAKNQADALQANQYFGPEQLSMNSDLSGRMTSYGFRGNVRSSDYDANSFTVSPAHYDNTTNYGGPKVVIPGTVTPNLGSPAVTINANFIDPAGLAAHSNNIATAVETAMKGGHSINDTIAQGSK